MAGVVVGMGRTADTGPAVRWAAREAELRGVPLTLVHAWSLPLDVTVPLGPDSHPDLPAGALSRAAHGTPADVLVARRPELLVLAGHAGSAHVPHVTAACLRASLGPVAVVPEDVRAPSRRVVVAVCGTDASRGALLWGAKEAALRGADLVVVHAWQALLVGRQSRLDSTVVPAHGRAATARLQEWVHASIGRDDVELHAPRGGPLDEMLEASQDADVVVVGRSRPHAGLGKVLHGALGHDLCALAPCPVVVVPIAG